jgi:hypothetical protein
MASRWAAASSPPERRALRFPAGLTLPRARSFAPAIAGRSDVLVVGAGPAGIGAALAAARAGAKTQLIESAGCLGGVWTAGMLTKIIDGGNKPGIMREILAAMGARGSAVAKQTKGAIYDPELMKLVLEEMCVAAGIKIRLHTQLVGAVTDPRIRPAGVDRRSFHRLLRRRRSRGPRGLPLRRWRQRRLCVPAHVAHGAARGREHGSRARVHSRDRRRAGQGALL